MTMATNTLFSTSRVRRTLTTQEPSWVRRALIGLALAFLTLFLFVPLFLVFYEALKRESMSTSLPLSNQMRYQQFNLL